MSRKSDFISEVRANVKALWNAQNNLRGLQNEWNALDYSTTLDNAVDFVGQNEGLTKTMVGACVFDTPDAIKVVFDAGHATNLAKLL